VPQGAAPPAADQENAGQVRRPTAKAPTAATRRSTVGSAVDAGTVADAANRNSRPAQPSRPQCVPAPRAAPAIGTPPPKPALQLWHHSLPLCQHFIPTCSARATHRGQLLVLLSHARRHGAPGSTAGASRDRWNSSIAEPPGQDPLQAARATMRDSIHGFRRSHGGWASNTPKCAGFWIPQLMKTVAIWGS